MSSAEKPLGKGAQPPTYDAVPLPKTPASATSSVVSSLAVSGVPAVCLSILVVELCERLAYYTFVGTQEFFLEHIGYSVSEAGALNASMATLCMCWALGAGWLADVVLGRYATIVTCALVYAAGALLATVAAWPTLDSALWYLLGIMVLVPMGTAGIKANISNFGADQYDTSDPEQAVAQEKFFSWFYFAINLGSAVAYGYLTTLGTNGGLGVPKKYGYFAAYLIATVCMCAALCIFRSGRRDYRIQDVQPRSSLSGVARYVSAAAASGSREAMAVMVGMLLLAAGIAISVMGAVMSRSSAAASLPALAAVCSGLGIILVVAPCLNPQWLGSANLPGEPLSGAEVGAYLRLLPVLISASLAFGALYNSMQYWYQQQACQMDLRIPFANEDSQFSGSFFMIADCLGIVIATPIALDWLNPRLDRALAGNFRIGSKFVLGIGFGVISVLLAAHLETMRRTMPVLPKMSNCAPEGIKMSDMPAGLMVIPYFLMGLCEIYTQPIVMHFAYSQSPPSMRTLAAVTWLVVAAVSNALFTVQIAALKPWVPNDLNLGHLEYGHFLNTGVGVIFCIVFLAALNRFQERNSSAATPDMQL